MAFLRGLFAAFPLLATGWLVLRAIALVVTIYWVVVCWRGRAPRPSF